ncbi:hypothetical protein BH09VER1_BH09VER1_30860 [soil metagenome]
MKSSTTDKIEGKVRQVTGAVKEKVGAYNRDPKMQDEGAAEKIRGRVQSKVGDIKKVFET